MIRRRAGRRVMRAAAVAAGLCLVFGAASVRAAPTEDGPVGATAGSSVAADDDAGAVAGVPLSIQVRLPTSLSTDVFADAAPAATNAAEGVAVIPLPPSAYPGIVGLATAALSVWTYRRRRR
jgi:hypothetical protein